MKRYSKGNVSTPAKRSRTRYTKSRRYTAPYLPRIRATIGQGPPKQLTMTHKYCSQQLTLTSSAGGLGTHKFSCNGLFNPDITGSPGAHQPMYFDQMSALYDHYCVLSSTIKVTFSTPGAPLAMSMRLGINVNDNTSHTPLDDGLAEANQSVLTHISAGSLITKQLTSKWNAKDYFGPSVLANTELQGGAGTNPTEQSYYVIFGQSMNGITTSAVLMDVEIKYTCVWKELVDIASS